MTAFELLLHVSTLMMLATPFLTLAFCATLVFGKEKAVKEYLERRENKWK